MRRLMAVAAILIVGTVACDNRGMVDPKAPPAVQNAMILAGNGHFFFAPPLAPSPTPNGAFNPRVAPVVEVCRVVTTECVVAARFTLESGTGGEVITVDEEAELYRVSWKTLGAGLANGRYRISVRTAPSDVSNTVLGSIDIFVTDPALIPAFAPPAMANGATQIIAFRIEEGALCATAVCIETRLDEDGGGVALPDSQAGAFFPPGSIPDDAGQVNVIIERFTDRTQPCLPTNNPQYEGCYRYRTEPHVTFEVPVTVGICLDPAAQSIQGQLELQKWDEVNPSTLVSLPRVSVDFLDCDGFQVSQAPSGLGGRLAHLGSELIKRVLGPDEAHAAVISPYGGKLSDFSRIGWVRPLTVTGNYGGPNPAAAPANSRSPIVEVRSSITGAAVSGVPIAWLATLGGGTVSPPSSTTDVNGRAGSTWYLRPGANHLVASASNPRPSWPGRAGVWGSTGFDAIGGVPLVYRALFIQPLGSLTASTVDAYGPVAPTLTICPLSAAVCGAAVFTKTNLPQDPATRLYTVNWPVPASLARGPYRISIMLLGKAIGTVEVQVVSTATTGLQIQAGTTAAISFSVER